MSRTTRIAAAVAAVLAFTLLATSFATRSAYADDLPYRAFGPGLKTGQVVEAFKGATSVGKTTVDGTGNWLLDIPAAKATNGDKITFAIDGVAANESITFQSGQFSTPPGLKLTVAAGATPTPVPTSTPAPAQTGPGTFAAKPVFAASGVAQVVFNGGTVQQLQKAATDSGAKGVWAQNAAGAFIVFIPGAPDFVNAAFNTAFANGFTVPTSISLTQ